MTKKVLAAVLVFLFLFVSCQVTFAFPREDYVWDRWSVHEKEHWNKHDKHHANKKGNRQFVVSYHDGYDDWYDSHRLSDWQVYYSEYRGDKAFRINYSTHEGRSFIQSLTRYHGKYTCKARCRYRGENALAYYWIGRDTIIRVIVREYGRTSVSVWHRDEVEDIAVQLGRVHWEDIDQYRSYQDIMPDGVANWYIANILIDD